MNFNVIGAGEVLWDLLPSGPQLGGAPANFAYHAHALGAASLVISRIGDDTRGREILTRFHEIEVPTEGLQIDSRAPTGTARVAIESDGLPHFVIEENVAWDHLEVPSKSLAAAGQAHAICFGSLAQRTPGSRHAIQTLVTATPSTALRVFDINLRQHYYSPDLIEDSLRLCNVLKLNAEELEKLASIFGLAGSVREQMEQLASRFGQNTVALTRGAAGSLLYQKGRWSENRCAAVEIVDTVGAGDAFTAAVVLGLLNKIDLYETNALANELAAYVCSHPGATPPIPTEFAQRFRTQR